MISQTYLQAYASQHTGQTQAWDQAAKLYREAHFWARLGGLASRLTGRSRRLLSLDNAGADGSDTSGHFAGLRTVPLGRIRGTEGRQDDFDIDFWPVQEHSQQRWLRVAMARQRGMTLPPVELIQVGDTYFVRDGHHRVSVARAMGEQSIEAEVTVRGREHRAR
jgi:hypothetical protein